MDRNIEGGALFNIFRDAGETTTTRRQILEMLGMDTVLPVAAAGVIGGFAASAEAASNSGGGTQAGVGLFVVLFGACVFVLYDDQMCSSGTVFPGGGNCFVSRTACEVLVHHTGSIHHACLSLDACFCCGPSSSREVQSQC